MQPIIYYLFIYLFILHTSHAVYKTITIADDVKYKYFIRKVYVLC